MTISPEHLFFVDTAHVMRRIHFDVLTLARINQDQLNAAVKDKKEACSLVSDFRSLNEAVEVLRQYAQPFITDPLDEKLHHSLERGAQTYFTSDYFLHLMNLACRDTLESVGRLATVRDVSFHKPFFDEPIRAARSLTGHQVFETSSLSDFLQDYAVALRRSYNIDKAEPKPSPELPIRITSVRASSGFPNQEYLPRHSGERREIVRGNLRLVP